MSALRPAVRLLKYGGIRAGLNAIALSRAASLFPAAAGRGLIFTLHHVLPQKETGKFTPNAILSVTPEFLETAIVTARQAGLTPVHLHDLPALLADPSDKRKFIAFTLDDGYRDNAEFAAPVFRRHGVPHTIFITAGFVERSRSLWWETAEALTRKASSFRFNFGGGPETVDAGTTARKYAAFERLASFIQATDEDDAVRRVESAALSNGIDPVEIIDDLVMDAAELRHLAEDDPLVHFGAHTLTHVNLRRVDDARLQSEIEGSADAVEKYVGCRPRSFSYPYGWSSAVGEREAAAAADAGFAAAVTTQPGVLGPAGIARPTMLPRISLNGLYQKKRYLEALISGLPFRFI
ncbi:MAG: polysaccharide deacetylase [Rhizobiaceae bacterium]|nr:MAG: polysaccharide deacetylase [Rhizobiaceae bacterium]